LTELVRHYPSDFLAFNLGLIVNAFYRQEDFAQAAGSYYVIQKFSRQSNTVVYHALFDFFRCWQGSKKENMAQAIVQVS
jgi:hypothetical protein